MDVLALGVVHGSIHLLWRIDPLPILVSDIVRACTRKQQCCLELQAYSHACMRTQASARSLAATHPMHLACCHERNYPLLTVILTAATILTTAILAATILAATITLAAFLTCTGRGQCCQHEMAISTSWHLARPSHSSCECSTRWPPLTILLQQFAASGSSILDLILKNEALAAQQAIRLKLDGDATCLRQGRALSQQAGAGLKSRIACSTGCCCMLHGDAAAHTHPCPQQGW